MKDKYLEIGSNKNHANLHVMLRTFDKSHKTNNNTNPMSSKTHAGGWFTLGAKENKNNVI